MPKSKLEMEAQTALGIATSMKQSIEELERFWPPSKRGSNAQRALIEIHQKRAAIEKCLSDGLEKTVEG